MEGAVFSLLGLLIAFTFSGAATRFEGRRHLIVEEADDIGTAYLRIHLLPASAQPALWDLFRQFGLAVGDVPEATGCRGGASGTVTFSPASG